MVFGNAMLGVRDFGLFEHSILVLADEIVRNMCLERYCIAGLRLRAILLWPRFQPFQPLPKVGALAADRRETHS
jgi:hypothetical protein